MDLIRATIKALYYDYSPQFVADVLMKETTEDFLSRFLVVVQRREDMFTRTEISVLKNVLKNQWVNKKGHTNLSKVARTLLLLNEFSNNVLVKDGDYPRITLDNLLRWRMLSMCVGEEVLLCSYLAENDSRGVNRTRFAWNHNIFVAPHSLTKDVLNEGLPDNHHHLWASIDVAELNWIQLMNNMMLWPDGKEKKLRVDNYEMDINNVWMEQKRSLRNWAAIASCIRVNLFKYLNHKGDFCVQQIESLIKGTDKECSHWVTDQLPNEIGLVNVRPIRVRDIKNWDYALFDGIEIDKTTLTSPYLLNFGERKLLYDAFREIYSNPNKKYSSDWAGYFYLYLLIKVHIRKEFVMTCSLKGLQTFMDYMIMERSFLRDCENQAVVDEMLWQYSVQTSLLTHSRNTLETRVTLDDYTKYARTPYRKAIIDMNSHVVDGHEKRVRSVIMFSKGHFYSLSHDEKMSIISNLIHVYVDHNEEQYQIPLVGVDFGGVEVDYRPESFAAYIRYMRLEGIRHFTYHVAEDFYDIIDGLRAIYELVTFAEFSDNDRIGHAIALGIDPKKYYEGRHYNAMIPAQVLLDNIVWLLYHTSKVSRTKSLRGILELKAKDLYKELKYPEKWNLELYYSSMLLRGDGMVESTASLGKWSSVAKCSIGNDIRANPEVRRLHEYYISHKKGDCRLYVYPKGIYRLVKVAQRCVLDILFNKGIAIECCPSSNLMIGAFQRYDELPILRVNKAHRDKPVFSQKC